MSDPTIKRSSVTIKYASSDGYRAEFVAKSPNPTAKLPPPPHMALLAGLEELSRLTALFGFEDEALEEFNGARARVAEWRANRHREAQASRPETGASVVSHEAQPNDQEGKSA